MKPLTITIGLALILTGCSKPDEHSKGETEEVTLNLFSVGKGVFLPDEMQKRFGVKLVEVIETNLPVQIEKSAQVSRVASGQSPANAVALLVPDEAQMVNVDQAVELKSSDTKITGKISQVDRSTEKASGQSEVVIEFPDPEKRFSLGNFLMVQFVVTKTESTIVVPKSALLAAADGDSVYVVNGEHFTRTKVKTGSATDSSVEILDGLYAGDVVVAEAVNDLWLVELQATKTGQACCVVPEK